MTLQPSLEMSPSVAKIMNSCFSEPTLRPGFTQLRVLLSNCDQEFFEPSLRSYVATQENPSDLEKKCRLLQTRIQFLETLLQENSIPFLEQPAEYFSSDSEEERKKQKIKKKKKKSKQKKSLYETGKQQIPLSPQQSSRKEVELPKLYTDYGQTTQPISPYLHPITETDSILYGEDAVPRGHIIF